MPSSRQTTRNNNKRNNNKRNAQRSSTPKAVLQRRYRPGAVEPGVVSLGLTDDAILPKVVAGLPSPPSDAAAAEGLRRLVDTPAKRRRVAARLAKDAMAQHARARLPPVTEVLTGSGAESYQMRHADGSPFDEKDVAECIEGRLEAVAETLAAPADDEDEWSAPSKPPIDPATGRRVLVEDGERLFMDELVLETFRGPRPCPEARAVHLDGDLANDELANLVWST